MGVKTTQKKAQDWLDQNHPKYKILEWGGSASTKSKFLDTERGVEFEKSFSYVRNKLSLHPDMIICATKKERGEKYKKSIKNKYGVGSVMLLSDIREKVKKTMMERYGVEVPQQSEAIRQKTKKTNLEKYGVEHTFQNEEVKEKIRQTHLEKLGVEYPTQAKEVRKKMRANNLEKYGVEYTLQIPEVRKKIINSRIKNGTMFTHKGKSIVEWNKDENLSSYTVLLECHKLGIPPDKKKKGVSDLQLILDEFLKNELKFNEVGNAGEAQKITDYTHGKGVWEQVGKPKTGRKYPDFCFPILKFIIEADGEHYHIKTPEQIKKDQKRNELYKKIGYDVLVFLGSEIKNETSFVKAQIVQHLKERGCFQAAFGKTPNKKYLKFEER